MADYLKRRADGDPAFADGRVYVFDDTALSQVIKEMLFDAACAGAPMTPAEVQTIDVLLARLERSRA